MKFLHPHSRWQPCATVHLLALDFLYNVHCRHEKAHGEPTYLLMRETYTECPGILGGHSIDHSKQKKKIIYVQNIELQTISELELFHCAVTKFFIKSIYYILYLALELIVQVSILVQSI
jgi:hypothetical protein